MYQTDSAICKSEHIIKAFSKKIKCFFFQLNQTALK